MKKKKYDYSNVKEKNKDLLMSNLNYGKNKWQPKNQEKRLNKKPKLLSNRRKMKSLKHK